MHKLKKNIVFLAIAFLAAGAASLWVSRDRGLFVIHFVNYRGKTVVDQKFEETLLSKGMRFRIVYHDANLEVKNLPGIRTDVMQDRSKHLVVTWGTPSALALFGKYNDDPHQFVRDVPGIFTMVADPMDSGLMAPTLEKRTITGASHVAPIENQFSAMMIYRPAKKIGILYSPNEPNSVAAYESLQAFAANFNIGIVAIPFDLENGKPSSRNAISAINEFRSKGVDWLYLPPDSFLASQAKDLVIPAAHAAGIPTFASTEGFMISGAAFGLISPFERLGKLAAEQAYNILIKGMDPSDVPIEGVQQFQHQYNKPVADSLGIKLREGIVLEIKDISK